MLRIGIFDKIDIYDIIEKLYTLQGLNSCISSDDKIIIKTDKKICFVSKNTINSIYEDGDIMLINSDKKNNFQLLAYSNAKIVTYGLNHKSCVTASSINEAEYKTIQFCIQRSIPTISGKFLEPQEFPVKICTKNNVSTVLAGVTVALINDFDVEIIKSCVI